MRDALDKYLRPHVLIVDEVGYLTYGDDAANVLYHVVNERHTRRKAMRSPRTSSASGGATCFVGKVDLVEDADSGVFRRQEQPADRCLVRA
jgi:hypothetical protein